MSDFGIAHQFGPVYVPGIREQPLKVGEKCPTCGHECEGGMQAPGGYCGCPTCGWCF